MKGKWVKGEGKFVVWKGNRRKGKGKKEGEGIGRVTCVSLFYLEDVVFLPQRCVYFDLFVLYPFSHAIITQTENF